MWGGKGTQQAISGGMTAGSSYSLASNTAEVHLISADSVRSCTFLPHPLWRPLVICGPAASSKSLLTSPVFCSYYTSCLRAFATQPVQFCVRFHHTIDTYVCTLFTSHPASPYTIALTVASCRDLCRPVGHYSTIVAHDSWSVTNDS